MGGDVHELIAVFLSSADDLVAAMRSALEAGDAEKLYRCAHTLKSSAANAGAADLSRLARRLEADARAGTVTEAAASIDTIHVELEQVRPLLLQAVRQLLQGARNAVS
jgi:HPt (histidine-containing phosphotransfer) domain-containing protein